MTNSRFAAYQAARAYYRNKPAVVSPYRPMSKRARAFMVGTMLAGVAAAIVLTPAAAIAAPAKYLGAVGAWTFYNKAKKYLGTGDIDLNAATLQMTLHTSASNAATATLSTYGSVTNEVTEANGYSSSGKALTYTWTVGASAGEWRLDATAAIWTASGGAISNVKFAVISVRGASAGARKLVCRSQLSTSQFTITQNNTLTITPDALGIFELNG